MTSKAVVFIGVAWLAGVAPSFAHHSFSAEFDIEKPLKLTGSITKIEWQNPHVWFYIDVKDETGRVANWAMELGSANALMRAGWSRNSVKLGETVTVDGFRARKAPEIGNAIRVTLARTGQRVFTVATEGAPR